MLMTLRKKAIFRPELTRHFYNKAMFSQTLFYLICIFFFLAVIAVFIMMHMFKVFDRDQELSSKNEYYPISFSSSHSQWEVRNKMYSDIISASKAELKSWSLKNRQNYLEEDIINEFDSRSSSFLDDVQTRSHINIPPYFASILGMDRLEKIAKDNETGLEEFGVAVLMGSSPIYSPPYKHVVIKDENVSKIDMDDC